MIKKTYPQEYYQKLDNISALIKEYRLDNGYTQMELAENLNLHRNTLSQSRRGKKRDRFNINWTLWETPVGHERTVLRDWVIPTLFQKSDVLKVFYCFYNWHFVPFTGILIK